MGPEERPVHEEEWTMRRVILAVAAAAVVGLLGSTTEAKPKAKKPSATAPASEGTWSLQEKEYWAKLQEEADGQAKRASEKCGVKLTATFAKESFRGHLTEGGSFGLSTYARSHCEAGMYVLEDICNNSELAKAAVKEKITTVECRWGGKGHAAVDLSSKKLVTTIDMDTDNASGYTEKVREFVKKKL
jgi:hypothetical protein